MSVSNWLFSVKVRIVGVLTWIWTGEKSHGPRS